MEEKERYVQNRSVWSPSQIATGRAAKRRSAYYVTLNFWPFVGVMIALLILFMINIRPYYHAWHAVDLPWALHPVPQPSAIREDSIRISITRKGDVFFRSDQIQLKDLPELIRNALENGSQKKAYVAVDRRAMYRDVKAVVDQIRPAGIFDICFLANKAARP